MNVKLTLAYDGTHYLGWQKTHMGPSIEATLEQVLAQVLRHPVVLQAASRTDAGVHAEGQVVNFFTDSSADLRKLQGALNGLLPKDISVYGIEQASENFHPTLNATGKEYHYKLCATPTQLPFHRNTSWHIYYPLNFDLMQQAAQQLIGTQDFSAFTNIRTDDAIRTITDIQLTTHPSLTIVVKGTSFLYKMVRNIVGTLVYVGCGKLPHDIIPQLLQNKDRREAGMTAPAHGLILKNVFY